MVITLKPGEKLFDLLKTNQLNFFSEVSRLHGDLVEVRMGVRTFHVVSRPELIKEVLVTQSKKFGKAGQLNLLGNLLGQGLLTSDGDLHLKQRRAMQPLFQPKVLQRYFQAIVEATDAVLNRWQPGEVRDVEADMTSLTLEVIGRTMFGADFGPMGERFKKIFDMLMRIYHKNAFDEDQLEEMDQTSAEVEVRNIQKFLDDLITELIHTRRQEPASGRGDFLDLCLASEMSDQQVRDEMITLIFAGHETTSGSLTWTLFLLASHPEIQSRLKLEIETVLGGQDLDRELLEQMPTFHNVIQESMRLYPAVWNITRLARQDCTIGDVMIKKASLVFMSPYVVQRDERYFASALTFDPDRWLTIKQDSDFSYRYFPFGAGVRKCLGENFAWLETALVLAKVVQAWEFKSVPEHAVVPLGLTTLKAKYGIKLKVFRS